jgi:uncharacterized protein YndB with AHSA1/START domain
MPYAANEVVIARPPGEVFAFVADAENAPRWRSGVLDIRREPGGGPGVGARYRQGVKGPGGRRVDADIEVTEYEPDRVVAFRTVAGPVRPHGRFTLAPAEGGTRVRFELQAALRGLKRLMAPMVKRSMDGEVAALGQLKRVLEERNGA